MLVLARFRGEKIRLQGAGKVNPQDDVLLEVLQIQDRQVTLKVDAPAELGGPKEATYGLFQRLSLGPQIKITVLFIGSNQIKLGIDAPPEVKIYREEVYFPDE